MEYAFIYKIIIVNKKVDTSILDDIMSALTDGTEATWSDHYEYVIDNRYYYNCKTSGKITEDALENTRVYFKNEGIRIFVEQYV